MNTFLPINNKKIGVLGSARSGVAAANLAKELGADVFISDAGKTNNIQTTGIKYEFGGHSSKILESDIIIKSPGIDNQSDIIKKIKKQSIPIVSEIEFASWFTKGFIIALTGTNGKTTTVELINHILKDKGLKTFLGGNIGVPFSYNVLEELRNKNNSNLFHILEISSFQLEDIKYFKPNISIILNIAPDHLDRHHNFTDYFNLKLNIMINQDHDCYAILNEEYIKNINKTNNVNEIKFKLSKDQKMFIEGKEEKLDINNSFLLGIHNYENILAAFITCKICGLSKESIIKSINNFKFLPHRLEKLVFNSKQIFYNDSKATNLHATLAALDSLGFNIILILGGIDKNNTDFSLLKKYKDKIKKIILYGDARGTISKHIDDLFCFFSYHNFNQAINKAIEISEENHEILLSPACASFDQFNNYKERGNCFKKIISDYYDKN